MIQATENFNKFVENFKLIDSESGREKFLLTFVQYVGSPDLPSLLTGVQSTRQNFFFWQKPDEACVTLGIGSLISINNHGKERTIKSESEINYWKDRRYSNLENSELSSIPLFMGGMKFSPSPLHDTTIWNDYHDSDWCVPEYIFKISGKSSRLIFNFVVDSDGAEKLYEKYNTGIIFLNNLFIEPQIKNETKILNSNLRDLEERSGWTEKVKMALDKISEKNLTKIVLSRKVTSWLDDKPQIIKLLSSLADNYPKCYIFAFAKNDSIFFGASPEKLAKISNGWVEADALAGSTPRGETEEEDDRLANELLMSKKNLAEQNAVVNFITNSFNEFTTDLSYDPRPKIRKLSNIQHLWTEVKAKLKSENSIFSILKEIHPTPAICGVPWSDALTFIESTEGYNRGLYAGIIGWFNFENEGEFAVAIRSALLRGKELHAFAGCGIVEGSDPDSEFEETELKLQPILSLFPHEKIYQP